MKASCLLGAVLLISPAVLADEVIDRFRTDVVVEESTKNALNCSIDAAYVFLEGNDNERVETIALAAFQRCIMEWKAAARITRARFPELRMSEQDILSMMMRGYTPAISGAAIELRTRRKMIGPSR